MPVSISKEQTSIVLYAFMASEGLLTNGSVLAFPIWSI